MRILAVVLGLFLPLLAGAQELAKAKFEEGVHYTVLAGQPKPAKTGDIEVTEIFWYGCGHCYSFDPVINTWKKTLPKGVVFNRSPAMWKQGGATPDAMWTHAKLYYTAAALGKLDPLHDVFFEAMHVKNQRLLDKSEISALVASKGLNGDAFIKTMDSFAVNSQVNMADARQKTYRITGTPEIVIAGYYHINASTAGGQKEMLDVADFVINKIKSQR